MAVDEFNAKLRPSQEVQSMVFRNTMLRILPFRSHGDLDNIRMITYHTSDYLRSLSQLLECAYQIAVTEPDL